MKTWQEVTIIRVSQFFTLTVSEPVLWQKRMIPLWFFTICSHLVTCCPKVPHYQITPTLTAPHNKCAQVSTDYKMFTVILTYLVVVYLNCTNINLSLLFWRSTQFLKTRFLFLLYSTELWGVKLPRLCISLPGALWRVLSITEQLWQDPGLANSSRPALNLVLSVA